MFKMKDIFRWIDGGFKVRFFKEDIEDFEEAIKDGLPIPSLNGMIDYRFQDGYHLVAEDNGESFLGHRDRWTPTKGIFGLLKHGYLDLPSIIRKYGKMSRLFLPFLKNFETYKEERPLPILDLTFKTRGG